MKAKIFTFALAYILLFPLSCFGQEKEISIYLDNKIFFTEHRAVIQDNRLMFSLKDISRLIDSDVTWHQEQNTAVISNEQGDIIFTVGQETVRIEQNGQMNVKAMNTKPVIINNRIYIPARFVSEISGYQVAWNGEHNKVNIVSSKENSDGKEKKIPIKIVKTEYKNNLKQTIKSPTTRVHYSPVSHNLEEIIHYIKNDIDKNFDIKDFDVRQGSSSYFADSKGFSTSIILNRKSGNFIFGDGYQININDGFVDNVFIIGDPSTPPKADELELEGGIDVEWLIGLAMDNIEIPKGYDVAEQEILYKYDYEPYYIVEVIFESSNNISFVRSFEYRIK